MAQLIVRKLDEDVKARLRARAKRHGRTLEAEARAILEEAAHRGRPTKRGRRRQPQKRHLNEEKGFGTLMHERFKKSGLTKEEARIFQKGIDEINGRSRL